MVIIYIAIAFIVSCLLVYLLMNSRIQAHTGIVQAPKLRIGMAFDLYFDRTLLNQKPINPNIRQEP
jgi:hypothetical protein